MAVAALAWRRPVTRVWAALLAAAVLLLLTSPSYFGHYGTFAAPALALVVGAGADQVLSWLAVRTPVVRPLVPALGLVALAVLGASRRHPAGGPPAATGERDVRRARRCPLRGGRQRSRAGRSPTCSPGTCGTGARWSST